MPKLAAFPKAFMQQLCKDGTMKIADWIALASKLDIQGLEWYAGFLEMEDKTKWPEFRKMVQDTGKVIPMMCCSPDFTIPDPVLRQREVDHEIHSIRMSAELGAKYCRVLSGQRRKDITREEGMGYVVDSIEKCLVEAEKVGVTLVIENHYKDDFWTEPEFAQMMDVFVDLVGRID